MIATSIQQRFTASAPPGRPSLPTAAYGPDKALALIPVLVIEDEAMIAWMLDSLLEDMGFRRSCSPRTLGRRPRPRRGERLG